MGQSLCSTLLGRCLTGERAQSLGHTRRTEQVHLDGTVEGGVKGHSRGGMDHDVTRPEQGAPSLVEPEPVLSHVSGDGVETAGDDTVKAFALLNAESVEAVVAQDFSPCALNGPLVLAGPDDHDYLAFGHAAKQPLDERCSEEARRPGHGDSPGGELVADHRSVSSTRLSDGEHFSCANGASRCPRRTGPPVDGSVRSLRPVSS